MKRFSLRLQSLRKQRLAFVFLSGSILLLLAFRFYLRDYFTDNQGKDIVPTKVLQDYRNRVVKLPQKNERFNKAVVINQPFDPNTLDLAGWMNLGFSEKQAAVILKYKKSLGGYFTKKEDLAKCFVISQEKFTSMEPYLVFNPRNFKKASIGFFDPNTLNQKGWEGLGFSERQAEVIIKYREKLGGFTSKEQIKSCFVISEKKYQEISPFIRFKSQPNKRPENEINTATAFDLQELGIDTEWANKIIIYRNALGGFYSLEQIQEVYKIPQEVAENAKNVLKINPKMVQRITISSAADKEKIQKHPYLRKHYVVLMKMFDKNELNEANLKSKLSEAEFDKVKSYLQFE